MYDKILERENEGVCETTSLSNQPDSLLNSDKEKKDYHMTEGKLLTLLNVDINKTFAIMINIHIIWSAPLQIIFGTYLLWMSIGKYAIVTIPLILLMAPFSNYIAKRIQQAERRVMKNKDKRFGKTTELFTNLINLKM